MIQWGGVIFHATKTPVSKKIVEYFYQLSGGRVLFWYFSALVFNISLLLFQQLDLDPGHTPLSIKEWEGINLSISWNLGNLKKTHVGDHQRVHTLERYPYIGGPYIGMLSIHRRVHTSEVLSFMTELKLGSSFWCMDHPYIGEWSIHQSSDV